MTEVIAMTHVYRHNSPPGAKGSLCRIKFAGVSYWPDGTQVIHGGAEFCTVELDDGRKFEAPRSSVALLGSKYARQTLARVARGDMAPSRDKAVHAAKMRELRTGKRARREVRT